MLEQTNSLHTVFWGNIPNSPMPSPQCPNALKDLNAFTASLNNWNFIYDLSNILETYFDFLHCIVQISSLKKHYNNWRTN